MTKSNKRSSFRRLAGAAARKRVKSEVKPVAQSGTRPTTQEQAPASNGKPSKLSRSWKGLVKLVTAASVIAGGIAGVVKFVDNEMSSQITTNTQIAGQFQTAANELQDSRGDQHYLGVKYLSNIVDEPNVNLCDVITLLTDYVKRQLPLPIPTGDSNCRTLGGLSPLRHPSGV